MNERGQTSAASMPLLPLLGFAVAAALILAGGAIRHTSSSLTLENLPVSDRPNLIAPPGRLRIPSLAVDVPLEPVGINWRGEMGMPKEAAIPGWYSLGYKPGQQGNAVIAGHLDTVAGTPGVFAKLDMVKIGDTVKIEDVTGNEFNFRIIDMQSYPANNAPRTEIFGKSDKHLLRLITCDGAWQAKKFSYEKRLVVTAELVIGD